MFSVQKKIKNSEHYTVMKGRTASTAVKILQILIFPIKIVYHTRTHINGVIKHLVKSRSSKSPPGMFPKMC